MNAFELAKQYYPRLWSKERLEALADAGKLTPEQLEQILEDNQT
ncbi:XkdX family protein [uncultured Flavonifractor sp.]|nr:XkdX family protein [uncultured Flavonifractor sp.]